MDTSTNQKTVNIVSGRITASGNRPLVKLRAVAFDKDLRSKQELGNSVVDSNGRYMIRYTNDQYVRAEKDSADLQIELYDPADRGYKTLVASSPVRFNAKQEEVIDILLSSEQMNMRSEFDAIEADVKPLLQHISEKDLEENGQHDDISFLSGETGWSYDKLEWFALACKLADRSGIDPAYWYALLLSRIIDSPLDGAPKDDKESYSLELRLKPILKKISKVSGPQAVDVVREAEKKNIIHAVTKEQLEKFTEAFTKFAVGLQLKGKDDPVFTAVLKAAGFDDTQLEKLVNLATEKGVLSEDFKTNLDKSGQFKTGDLDKIANVVKLNELLMGDTALMNAVVSDAANDLSALAKKSTMEWESILKKLPDAAPKEMNPKDATNFIRNRAITINKRVEDTFPTVAFVGGLKRGIDNSSTKLTNAQNLYDFLESNPNFDLQQTSLERYLKANRSQQNKKLAADSSFIAETKGVQRLAKLIPRYKAVESLMSDNIHSAQQIYAMGRNQFRKKYKNKPGFTEKLADEAFNKASDTHAAVMMMVGELRSMETASSVAALNASQDLAVEMFPNWSSLFGSTDVCECEHCRSVYSPSAYMADLLQFLKNRLLPVGTGNARDILFARRPDIGFIDLNCKNANTPINYTDRACEIMEDEIAPQVLFTGAITAVNWTNDATIAATLTAMFGANGITLSGALDVSDIKTVKDRTTYTCRVARDEKATYKIVINGAITQVTVTELKQTHGKAEELAASPEYVNEAAYALLSAATYPSNLPLDLFTEEARLFLEKVEVKKWELMEAFRGNNAPNNPSDTDIAAEYLSISSSERQYIFSSDTATQHKFWGYSSTAAMLTGIKNVKTFLDKTDITYNDLQKLLDLSYVNPGKAIVIQPLDNSCDLDKKELQVLNAPAMDRIHRFLRLWRKLGWKMWELDYAIMHPAIGGSDIGNTLLVQLMYCGRILEKFSDITIEQIGSLLGDINTTTKFTEAFEPREPSLYDNLFLNKKLINPIDVAFTLPMPATTIIQHGGVVIGASRIREQDLYLLLQLKRTNGTDYLAGNVNAALSLPNLSFIYRHSLFARFNEIKLKDWTRFMDLFQVTIVNFSDPKDVFEWIEKIDLCKEAYSTDEFMYLLAHDSTSKLYPQKKKLDAFITSVRTGIKKIKDSYAMPSTAEQVSSALSGGLQKMSLHEEAIAGLVKIFNNQYDQTYKLAAALPNNFTSFPTAVTNAMAVNYAADKLTFSFTGVMTSAQKNTLLTDPAIDPLVLADANYIQTVNKFYDTPRTLIVRELSYFEKPLFRDPLATANAPTDNDFKKLSSILLRNDCWFDAEKQQLVYRGIMTSDERSALLALLPNAPYQTAVQNLFTASAAYASPAGNQWVQAADINTLFNLPAAITAELAITNSQNVLSILYNYVEPKDHESFIVQQASQEFQVETEVARFLTVQYNFFAAPHFTILNYLKNQLPPYTEDEKIYHWLTKVSFIATKEKMDIDAFNWHRDFFATTAMLDWQTLPTVTVGGAGYASIDTLCTLHRYMEFNSRWTVPDVSLFTITKKLNTGLYATSADLAKDFVLWNEWNEEDVVELAKMLPTQTLTLNYPADWIKIKSLRRIDKAMKMTQAINARASFVRELANPSISKVVASKLKQSIRAKYDEQSWLDISKGIQDKLRERKRDGLSGYLLANKPAYVPATQRWETRDDLFSFYLIDVEMCACQITSRIVQANGSIQLFTQRCLMGLESAVKVDKDEDENWLHWKWMKNYRVWEANRKVFLYPENWIEPELRRDKSIFFKDFENELMQNEVNKDNVETAFLNYLEKLDGVAQLEIAGFTYEEDKDILHVFGRTPASEPHMYFYRKLVQNRRWTAWSKVEVDIKSDYLVPSIINERLYIFWPEFSEEPKPAGPQSIPTATSGGTRDESEKFLRIRMGVSEWRNNKWLSKKLSKDSIISNSYRGELLKDKYRFIPVDMTNKGKGFYIKCDGNGTVKDSYGNFATSAASISGTFEVFGCKGIPELTLDSVGVIYDLQSVVETEPEFMRAKEISSRSGTNDFFTFGLLQSLAVNSSPSGIAKAVHILEKTPLQRGIFKVTTSLRLSELDKLYSNTLYNFYKDRMQVSGIWADFFFNDKYRTFFVQPMLNLPEKISYYKDVKEYVDGFHRVFQQSVEDWLTSLGITGALAQALRDWFEKYFNTIAVAILGAWLPYRQYYFKNFYHPFVCTFAKEVLNRGIDGLMRREIQLKQSNFNFRTTYEPTAKVFDIVPTGQTTSPYYPVENVDFSGGGSYSQYNWELFFHAPLLIAGNLSRNQRFEEAMQWYHYIFNPLSVELKDAQGNVIPVTEPQQKFWITKPFFENLSSDYAKQRIDNIMKMLAGDTTVPGFSNPYLQELKNQVEDWRDNPFEPHKIAEFRVVAYQKTVVMKYIDNLIAWGDQSFRQDTMESINEATQLYIRAAEILGRKPRKVAPANKPAIETYNELEPRLDVFSNALINVENFIAPMPGTGTGTTGSVPLPTVLYFCIPQNDKLLGYWDLVADRLYKIRHCLNIEGVFRQLALFAPEIDPGALVRAIAGGMDISSALSDLNAPTPHYRYTYTLQKANEVCNDVKALGASLLTALEKKDGEALSLLRQTHELKNLEAIKDVKQKQLEDAKTAVEALNKNKEMVTLRRDYYAGRQFMNAGEITASTLGGTTIALQAVAMSMDILGGVLTVIPDFTLGASGFGGSPMAVAKIGGMSIGKALELASKSISQTVGIIDKSAALVSTVAGYQRRFEDWMHQKDLASKELEQIGKNIASAQFKVDIAEKELKNHEQQIENSKAIDEFMRSKYTNKELYEWMIGQISQTYFQSYQLAYDLSKRAEKCFQYELGIQNSSYIQFGYWDSLKKGLQSGEKLQFDLRRLDAAYSEQNRRELELTKHISLSLLDPMALVQLRETGSCVVNLGESIFDLDYPGHYFRRIKSIAVSIPCIAGPHTTINCTIRLLNNSVRINPSLSSNKYERNNDGGVPLDDMRFRESTVNIKSIATSGAQNDSGVFELNFRDERYLPFEGAGAISKWSIELLSHPDEDTRMLRQFDYSKIADFLIHVRYTAKEDAGLFKKKAIEYLKNLVKDAVANTTMPLMQLINIRDEFADEFNALLTTPAAQANGSVLLRIDKDRFPYLASSLKLRIKSMMLASSFTDGGTANVDLLDPDGLPSPGGLTISLANTPRFGSRIKYGIRPFDFEVKNSDVIGATFDWTLAMPRARAIKLKELFIIMEYELKP